MLEIWDYNSNKIKIEKRRYYNYDNDPNDPKSY